MSQMIAYCGLVCYKCPTFLATQNDDDDARAKTANYYSRTYGFNLKPEEINCDGCKSKSGKLIAYCRSCAIRKCCSEKDFVHCAVCPDQPCAKLAKFHAFSSDAKTCFEALKKNSG